MSEFEREGRYDEPEDTVRETDGADVSPDDVPENIPDDVPEERESEEGGENTEAVRRPSQSFAIPPLVKTTLVLFLITALSALLLGVAKAVTAEQIERHRQEAVDNALSAVLPGCDEYLPVELNEPAGSANTLYTAVKNGQEAGFAVLAEPSGYGGPITMIVGIDTAGQVTGVSIIKMTETAGLGTKCGEPEFLSRFTGKRAGVAVGRGENEVDAITGSTVSSRAVTQGVADALAAAAAYQAGQ